MLCLPELCINGYGCEDAFLAPGTLRQSLNILYDIAKYSSKMYPIGDVSYIYTNLLGNEAGRAIYDGDAMIASNKKILASSSRFNFDNYQSISEFIDVLKHTPVNVLIKWIIVLILLLNIQLFHHVKKLSLLHQNFQRKKNFN